MAARVAVRLVCVFGAPVRVMFQMRRTSVIAGERAELAWVSGCCGLPLFLCSLSVLEFQHEKLWMLQTVGATPLFIASMFGHSDIVEALLLSGGSVDKPVVSADALT